MFLHGGLFHILFNMLALWMFGAELERIWGTRYFLKFYFVTGIGAGVLTVLFSLLPFGFAQQLYSTRSSSARPARSTGCCSPTRCTSRTGRSTCISCSRSRRSIFVMIMGAIAFYSSLGEAGGVANATHLGGLLVGYLFLKSARMHPLAELKYRYLKWKINRVAQEVRRLLRRPRGRLRSPRPLNHTRSDTTSPRLRFVRFRFSF